MTDDDFYADPTIFDRWQRRAAGWFRPRLANIRRYAWVAALFAAAGLLLATAVYLLVFSVWTRIGSEPTSSWNASFAQWLTGWLALLTGHHLLQNTARAWPMDAPVPGRFDMILGWFDALPSRPGDNAVLEGTSQVAVVSRVVADDRESKRFLLALRKIGVSVGVAKSLSAAGIRCARQLRCTPDADLLRIRGVGPATLSRLRMIGSRNS